MNPYPKTSELPGTDVIAAPINPPVHDSAVATVTPFSLASVMSLLARSFVIISLLKAIFLLFLMIRFQIATEVYSFIQ